MYPLGDPLTTCPIQTGWEFSMEPYLSGQFGFIDDPDCQFGNGLVWNRTRTRSDGPEPWRTPLVAFRCVVIIKSVWFNSRHDGWNQPPILEPIPCLGTWDDILNWGMKNPSNLVHLTLPWSPHITIISNTYMNRGGVIHTLSSYTSDCIILCWVLLCCTIFLLLY